MGHLAFNVALFQRDRASARQ